MLWEITWTVVIDVSIFGSFVRILSVALAIFAAMMLLIDAFVSMDACFIVNLDFSRKLALGQVHRYVHQTALKIILRIQNTFSFTTGFTLSFITFPVNIAISSVLFKWYITLFLIGLHPRLLVVINSTSHHRKKKFPMLFQGFECLHKNKS